MLNFLLIGNGAWGKNYISTCKEFPLINLNVANRDNWKNLVDKKPHGVIIATPPDTHVSIAKYCLEKSIPVLIEKPLSLSLDEAKELLPYSNNILINNIHLFSDAYVNIKNLIKNSEIFTIQTYGIGQKRREYSNLFDYGIHDISIILDLVKNESPTAVYCKKFEGNNFEYYDISLNFKNTNAKCITGVNSIKSRDLYIETKEFEIEYDDLKRPDTHNKPINNVLSVFYNFIAYNKKDYRIGLDLSLNALQILEKCESLI